MAIGREGPTLRSGQAPTGQDLVAKVSFTGPLAICTDILIVTTTSCGALSGRPGAGSTPERSNEASMPRIDRFPIMRSGFLP